VNLLQGDLLMSLFDDGFAVPERGAKYRYLSILVVVPIAAISLGLLFWLGVSLPWWGALPLGVATIALCLLLVLRIVNRILPKKFPTGEDS
jgi:uncharacterized membrane protein YbhN (UPF0104 family)